MDTVSPCISVYTWTTPNGHKIHIACEELGLHWKAIPIHIGQGDQFKPEFLAISPNNKIPAIVDPDGPEGKPITIFESGAILLYLAEKTGQLIGNTPTQRLNVIQWLMFQMGAVGPMLGQAHHFRVYAPTPVQYAIDRYTNEAKRLYQVMDKQLAKNEYLAGDYSIADIATFPWVRSWQRQGIELDQYPNVQRWFNQIDQRPAVIKALKTLSEHTQALLTEQSKANLFGDKQYQKR